MKDWQISPRKLTSQNRKLSLSQKTRSDVSNPNSPQDYSPVLMGLSIKTIGRKYAQDNLFKFEPKQHHEIIISDEVVRNSKLYRSLREKITLRQALFTKQTKQLQEVQQRLTQEISQINRKNHNAKLNNWQLKNKILELKAMLIEQQQESRQLQSQMDNQQQPLYTQQDSQLDQQMPNQQLERVCLSSQQSAQKKQSNKFEWLGLQNSELKQQQMDVKLFMNHLNKKVGLNPQFQNQSSRSKIKQQHQRQIE